MGLLRYTASADNTITNGYQLDLKTRGSGAIAGVADVLEVYSMTEQLEMFQNLEV